MSHLVEFLRAHALALPPLVKFAAVMALIVCVPRLSRRVGLPGVIGLLLSGIVIGPYGLDLGGTNRPIFDFFGELGKLLLMYCAGLEIDLTPFRRAKNRVIAFGLLTTAIPQLLGTGVGFLFGYPPVAAVVLGSLLASHTLLAGPIVAKLGAIRLEPVAVTYGVSFRRACVT
jgi:Kef-type K+ transport system membrane component KefB